MDQVSWWPTRHTLATNNPEMCKIYRVELLLWNFQQPFAHGTEEGHDAGVRAVPCPKRLCGFTPCEGWRIWIEKKTSSKYVPSYLIVKKESVEQTWLQGED